ncbi:helix-turn-helix domain-containing protein [Sphingobacterium bovistauri]|nr:AraC family transcriptional regulator [Sphingobacterium bovistauri]
MRTAHDWAGVIYLSIKSAIKYTNTTIYNGVFKVSLCTMAKVPVIAQCVVSDGLNQDIMIESLSDYLVRNSNLVFPHRHNFYHFVLFTAGQGSHTIDFEKFVIEPWQIYFMSPGQIHTWEFEGDMQGYVVNFHRDLFKNILLRSDYLTTLSFFSGLVRDEVFVVNEEDRPLVLEILERLVKDNTQNDFVSSSLYYLFNLLNARGLPSLNQDTNAYNHTLLRNFLNLIEANFTSLRLPKEYAALLYITPNHLNALCKELLGQSAGELIRDRVILEAKRLLVIKDYSVAEIAYELNFNDNSYFTKFFKKAVGLTPEEFRKNI